MPVGDQDSARLVTLRLSPDTHKALRIRVAEQDTSIQKYVEALVERDLGIIGDSRKNKTSDKKKK